MSIIKRIQQDLVEADVNHDGRIDFEELKLLLAKYPDTFTTQDIERIGDLFFVGQSGSSVRHSTFLRGVQHVMSHRSDSKSNPLHMESLDDKRCWVSPDEKEEQQFYDVQAEFDQRLSEYVEQVCTKTDNKKKD